MKSLFSGLLTSVIIGALGLIVLRATGYLKFPSSSSPSPTPLAEISPNYALAPSPTLLPTPLPSSTPYPEIKPATKGGLVLGSQIKRAVKPAIKTAASTHLSLTLIDSDKCPIDVRSELTELSGPLTLKYEVKDNYSATVTIWKLNGEEVLSQTLIKNSGILKSVDGQDPLKLQIVSKTCESDTGHWLKITASR